MEITLKESNFDVFNKRAMKRGWWTTESLKSPNVSAALAILRSTDVMTYMMFRKQFNYSKSQDHSINCLASNIIRGLEKNGLISIGSFVAPRYYDTPRGRIIARKNEQRMVLSRSLIQLTNHARSILDFDCPNFSY